MKGIINLINQWGSTLFAQSPGGTFWLPPKASTVAPEVDATFYFIYWISVIFFILIVSLMIAFIILYRKRDHVKDLPEAPKHHFALEMTWTIIPLILVIFIFYFGFRAFVDNMIAPANAYEIQVTGQKWQWFFTYPNGHTDPDLHVPVDRPIKLIITSVDVTHSLYIPAFRVKMDAVPGRYTSLWFHPTMEGQFHIFCAEYCGTSHSDMLAMTYVHPPGQFEAWMQEASNFVATMPPAEAGERLYNIKGCKQCHSIDGTAGHGPTFGGENGIFGKEVPLQDGSTVTVDENYIRESILDPMAKIHAGFEPVMPTYKGKIKDLEISAVIAYIKKLSGMQVDETPLGGEQAAGDEIGDATGASAQTESQTESNAVLQENAPQISPEGNQ